MEETKLKNIFNYKKNRKLSAILFFLTLNSFFLPWGAVGRTSYGHFYKNGEFVKNTVHGRSLIILLLIIIIGFCFSFPKKKWSVIIAVIMSALALLWSNFIMFVHRVDLTGPWHVHYEFGYFLFELFLIAAGILNIYSLGKE